MAELADALDSGSSRGSSVKVQVLLPAPQKSLENTEFSRLFCFSLSVVTRLSGDAPPMAVRLPILSSLLYAIRQYHAQSNDYLDLKQ